MTDTALSSLYPSATPAVPATPAARAAPVAVQPSAPAAEPKALASKDAKAETPKQGAAALAATTDEANRVAETERRTEAEPPVNDRPAMSLYGDNVETKHPVKWDEPAAKNVEDIKLHTSFMDHADLSPEGDAARANLAKAFVAAGAGPTVARELFADAARAAKDGYNASTAESTEAELRELWGSQYATKIAGAVELVQKAAAADPSIVEFLERTGLGNDPKFIRKIANRAAAMSRAKFGRTTKSILGAIVLASALLLPITAHAQMKATPPHNSRFLSQGNVERGGGPPQAPPLSCVVTRHDPKPYRVTACPYTRPRLSHFGALRPWPAPIAEPAAASRRTFIPLDNKQDIT